MGKDVAERGRSVTVGGVLMNTAIAEAEEAEKMAVQAGTLAFESGRMPKRLYASASSPLTGVVR